MGATVNNIVDADRPELPLNAGGGLALLIPRGKGQPLAMIGADVVADFSSTDDTTWGWALGTQIAITQSVWIRGGYNVAAATQAKKWSGGFSYVGDQWGIDYALTVPRGGGPAIHNINMNLLVF